MDNVDEQIDTVSRSVLAPDGELRPLPRPQVRPDPDDRLLRPGRHLPQHRPLRRPAEQDGRRRPGLLRHGDAAPPRAGDAARPEARPRRSRRRRRRCETARTEFEAHPRHAGGRSSGADGRPKQAIARQKMNQLQNELLALTDPAANGQVALGVRDAKTVGDTEIRIRGEAEKLGPIVPRGFLSVLDVPDAAEDQPEAERPARTGAVADQREESAHAAGDGQPRLAAPVRPGPGDQRRQLRRDRRRAVASRSCSITWRRGSSATAGRSRSWCGRWC